VLFGAEGYKSNDCNCEGKDRATSQMME
jgi:hypothetical protein